MRSKGKITHWNGEKGFGFITRDAGVKQVFVHISAFSNRSVAPKSKEFDPKSEMSV